MATGIRSSYPLVSEDSLCFNTYTANTKAPAMEKLPAVRCLLTAAMFYETNKEATAGHEGPTQKISSSFFFKARLLTGNFYRSAHA